MTLSGFRATRTTPVVSCLVRVQASRVVETRCSGRGMDRREVRTSHPEARAGI